MHWETISPDLSAFEADKQVISGSPITRDITSEEYYSTLYSIRESKLKEGLIWTGSNDGVVSVTQDGGTTWKNVTSKKMPKGGRIESVEPSQFNPAKTYIAIDMHLLGDAKPYLYKTENYGESWELISTATNGIPSDYTTRVLREDPVREGLLYAGTEFGMFVSFNDGKTWEKFQQNLPVMPITDLKIFRGDLVLSTMGRGFWILDNITPLRQQAITSLKNTPVLFTPDTTIRYRYPKVSSRVFPNYPRTSVILDYYIPKGIKGGVQLEILNANKESVVTIVSDKTQLQSTVTEVENMDISHTFRYVDTKLEEKEGLHRFHWNLQQKGAWDKDEKRSYKYGPMVAPGTYFAILKVNGTTYEQPFEIVIDPRVMASGLTVADIEAQINIQNKLIDLLSEVKKLIVKLEDKIKKSTGARQNLLKTVLKKLKNNSGAYPQQMLVSQISYLLYMISGAGQLPGQEALDRYAELVQQLNAIKTEVE